MKNLLVLVAPALVLLGILVVIFTDQDPGLAYKPDMFARGGEVAGALFVVAVFLERSAAVLNGLLFGEETRVQEAVVMSAPAFSPSAQTAEVRLAQLDAWKERLRLAIGFLFALLVAGAGARTLEGLMALPPAGGQLTLFRAVDVILTAGLLAGGSNALGLIVELFKKQATATLHRLRAETKTVVVTAARES